MSLHDDIFKGIWADQPETWENRLDECEMVVMQETGLSREKLNKVIRVLHENRIVYG